MEVQEYINQKIEVYNLLLEYLETETDDIYILQNLINLLETQKVHNNRAELRSFLRLVLKISKHHHRNAIFFNKIEQILHHFENGIKQTFSNYETFNIFKKNKRILLFLFQNNIITLDESIIDYFYNQDNLKHQQFRLFFSPEVKSATVDGERLNKLEKEISSIDPKLFDNFEEKREIGENHFYICKLIRNDEVQEFISYINRKNISVKTKIEPSIYETNSFLIGKYLSLIEYAAFFGSIQIFRYLKMNKVELNSSLWIYAIHGKSAEIIHLLEENNIEPADGSYDQCLKESIKCHHNDIANYFRNNFINHDYENLQIENKFDENVVAYSFKYYNYLFFPSDFGHRFVFYYLCRYDYYSLVEILYKTKKFNLNEEIIN